MGHTVTALQRMRERVRQQQPPQGESEVHQSPLSAADECIVTSAEQAPPHEQQETGTTVIHGEDSSLLETEPHCVTSAEVMPMVRPERAVPGWNSPEYTVTRGVPLNPARMEQEKCVGYFTQGVELEPYRVLRTRIMQRIAERGGNSIMITSAYPGEGKSLTAMNLAMACANEFRQTVLLVDGDLKHQRLHSLAGVESPLGLGDFLLDKATISDIMLWPGIEKLTMISGGTTVQNSSELLASPRMEGLMSEMKSRYPDRLLVFDAPSILDSADALVLSLLVDHILVVVQADVTPMPEVSRAVGLLPEGKFLGLVLNRQKTGYASLPVQSPGSGSIHTSYHCAP